MSQVQASSEQVVMNLNLNIKEPSPKSISNGLPQVQAPNRKLSKDDFNFTKTLGKGSFGEVTLAKNKIDKQKYAIKVLSKAFMEKVLPRSCQTNSQKNAISEREFLSMFKCRQIPVLFSCFQDTQFLYYVMEYCNGGTLADYLASQSTIDLLSSRETRHSRDSKVNCRVDHHT